MLCLLLLYCSLVCNATHETLLLAMRITCIFRKTEFCMIPMHVMVMSKASMPHAQHLLILPEHGCQCIDSTGVLPA